MKIKNLKLKIRNLNAGMSYVELIVVLSIFSALSSIAVFSYGSFQAKVDIKNLASDIALQIVQAQKSSLSGLLPLSGYNPSTWKPSYGVYFFNPVSDNKNFIYFVDLNNDTQYLDGSNCAGECLNKISITKNNSISRLDIFYQSNPDVAVPIQDLAISFSRPNSGTVLFSGGALLSGVSYARITVTSPKLITAIIKVYSSGRIQIN
ncbi:MAG: type II secretion system protein [Patescibacteria group bacterium]